MICVENGTRQVLVLKIICFTLNLQRTRPPGRGPRLSPICIFADQPELHRRTGDGALDTLFIRGRHMQISTWVSSQKLRLISAAVRVNMQFMCVWRLRNQLELEAVLEELTALLPKKELQAIYEEATREPYSFLFIHYLKPRAEMFYKRWEERFVIENGDDPEPSGGQDPGGRPGLRQ